MAGEEATGGASRFSRRARPRDEASFTRNLRFELADEEGRALLGSWLLSAGFGLLWILLVMFGPPDNLGTIVGLAGAGLTVALKDFILGFAGWVSDVFYGGALIVAISLTTWLSPGQRTS